MSLTRKRFLGLAGRGALGAAAYSTFGFLDRCESATTGPCATKKPQATKRFLYRGSAVGVGGRISDPPLGEIPSQAATTLPIDGGTAEARVQGYGFHGIVSIDSAHSVIRGNPDLKTMGIDCADVFRTVTTSTVNGLDIDGVVRADSMAAVLESEQPDGGGQLNMVPVGYFNNLRIRGFKIEPKLHTHLLEFPTMDEVWKNCYGHLYDPGRNDYDPYDSSQREPPKPVPAERTRLSSGGYQVACSIFEDDDLAAQIKPLNKYGIWYSHGGKIWIRDFGKLYLGEFFINADARRLTLLRVELNSPPSGEIAFASVEGDGRPR
jgi:hypothetical protein